MSKQVIEMVTYKLNDGMDKDAFIKAALAMNPWIEAQPGFLQRRLSCAEDGTWIEHVHWTDMASAKAAAAGIGSDPANAEALAAIAGPSVQVSHSELEIMIN